MRAKRSGLAILTTPRASDGRRVTEPRAPAKSSATCGRRRDPCRESEENLRSQGFTRAEDDGRGKPEREIRRPMAEGIS